MTTVHRAILLEQNGYNFHHAKQIGLFFSLTHTSGLQPVIPVSISFMPDARVKFSPLTVISLLPNVEIHKGSMDLMLMCY